MKIIRAVLLIAVIVLAINFGYTKVCISSNIHTEVNYNQIIDSFCGPNYVLKNIGSDTIHVQSLVRTENGLEVSNENYAKVKLNGILYINGDDVYNYKLNSKSDVKYKLIRGVAKQTEEKEEFNIQQQLEDLQKQITELMDRFE